MAGTGSLGEIASEDVRCADTGKLLARMSKEGLYLHCKVCKKEHLIAWEKLREALLNYPYERVLY